MKRFNIVICALALCAAHAHGMELAQPKKKIKLNVDQRIKIETQDDGRYLPKADAQLFGTIKNLLQDKKDDLPIPLPEVSGKAMDKMLEDLQWIRQMDTVHNNNNNNAAMSDDQIAALSEAERSRRAKIAVQSILIPRYATAVLQDEIEYFNGAVFLKNPECIELGAYRVAKLLCLPESMAEFHESDETNEQKHPLLDEKYRIPQEVKSVVHGYMPQGWPRQSLLEHEGAVVLVAFSPDGKYLATGSDDRKVRIYNIATRELKEIGLHDWVDSVAFSPDGKYLVTGSYKKVRIYNIATGELKDIEHNVDVNSVAFNSVAFSSDGKYFATGARDEKAHVYECLTTNTCDQALLVTYLQWCRDNKKSENHLGWVNKIKETYEDRTALEKAFPEKLTLQEFDDQE